MAKIPTADSLTYSTPQTAMKSGSYNVRPMASPVGGLDKAGEEMLAEGLRQKKLMDSYQADKAKVEFLRTESDLRMKYETDPDYQTAPDRMRAELDAKRAQLMAPLTGEAKNDYDIWSQEQGIRSYESQDNDRKTKYKSEELGIWKTNTDFMESRAAQQKTAGDLKGFAETMQQLNAQDEHIAALSPEALGVVAQSRSGARAARIGKLMADNMSAQDVGKWLDTSKPPQPSPVVDNEAVYRAFVGQESSGNKDAVSRDKQGNPIAYGEYQITPDTFNRFKKEGEVISNHADNERVGKRMLAQFMHDYNGDVGRVAVAYFSGEGNVAPEGSAVPYLRNTKDGNGKYTADYANDIVERTGQTDGRRSTGVFEIDRWRDSDPIGFKNFVDQKVAEKSRDSVVAKSNFELSIASTDKPAELQAIKLKVDQDPYMDVIAKNELKMKIITQGKEAEKKLASVTRGNMFLSGDAYLNPKDTDAVKDANNAYEALEPALKEKTPQERNYILSDMINKTGFVPDNVKGNIQSAARSQNKEVVVNAADFLDRVSISNPNMVGELADEKDLARIRMINDRINAGVKPEVAMAEVDKALAPVNAATAEAVKEELKVIAGKLPTNHWRDAALANFKGYMNTGNFSNPRTSGVAVADQIDGMAGKYRQAYEDNYMITRDKDLAEKRAGEVIRGQYGVSDVNGFHQILQFNPEKYYPPIGGNYDWMRSQMLEDAKEYYKGKEGAPTDAALEKNLRLFVDGGLTQRSISSGKVLYRLGVVKPDHIEFINPKGTPFFFNRELATQKILEKEKADKKNPSTTEYKSMDGFQINMRKYPGSH